MFTPETLAFLSENHFMNSREWFAENKERYRKSILEPLMQLTCELAPSLENIDSLIVTEPKVDRAISRIYRDIRFAKDKTLYRDMMWLTFKRDKKEFPAYPEFFFVFSPKEYFYGCGYYSATADAIQSLQKLILSKSPLFEKARRFYDGQSDFKIEGDRFKRTRYPDADEKLREWLDCKNICLMKRSGDINELYSEDLSEKIASDFSKLRPVYNLFIEAENKKSDAV